MSSDFHIVRPRHKTITTDPCVPWTNTIQAIHKLWHTVKQKFLQLWKWCSEVAHRIKRNNNRKLALRVNHVQTSKKVPCVQHIQILSFKSVLHLPICSAIKFSSSDHLLKQYNSYLCWMKMVTHFNSQYFCSKYDFV